MIRWRTLALLSVLVALAACNKDKAAEPPAELVDFAEAALEVTDRREVAEGLLQRLASGA